MDSSIRLFNVRGIAIRMHITFPLILVWAALQFGIISQMGMRGALAGVIITLLLFTIVVLHELGHSMAAVNYGVPVKQIVLLPIGGVAQLGKMPDKPFQEFVIAVAGPAVNFSLAILLGAVGWFLGYRFEISQLSAAFTGLSQANAASIFSYIFASNLFLGVFNLLPAFPMDGGRILRALLALRIKYSQATAIAVSIGRLLAWLMGLWGLLSGSFFLIVIAVFIYTGAGQEGKIVQLRSVLEGITVAQAYSRQAKALTPESTLQDAVDLTLNSFQSDFPVCSQEELVGLLPHSKLIDAINRFPLHTPIKEVMLTDIKPVNLWEGLFQVQQQLAELKIDSLPVVEGGRFKGLITSRDLSEVYRLLAGRPDLLAPQGQV
jgi:Zn-dependent protease/CBS domain-containing protein